MITVYSNDDREIDIYEMTLEELEEYLEELREDLEALDKKEPKNMFSEKYDDWAEEHVELEDLIDEILDRLDELR